MVEIKLSMRQFNLLLRCIKNKKHLKYQANNYAIKITENEKETISEIINAIDLYYTRFGVKYNNEPNKLGVELEELKTIFASQLNKISPS